MKKYPLVSIIVVNYNGKKYLKGCFGSLYNLNYPKDKLEIIMVDNCSSDDSAEYLKKLYPKVEVIKNDVNNYCKANNLGLRKARGKYVAFMNNDIIVDKEWLVELMRVMGNDRNIAGVGSKILRLSDKRIQSAGLCAVANFYWDERGAGQENTKYSTVEDVDALCGCGALYRKDIISKIGSFDEDYYMYNEDVDLSLRLKAKGLRLLFVPASIIYHIVHGSGDEDLSKRFIERNRLLLIAKFFPYKLSSALWGRGYYSITNPDAGGNFISVLMDVFKKIRKHHSRALTEKIITESLEELKNIFQEDKNKVRLESDARNTEIDNAYKKIEKFYKDLDKKKITLEQALAQVKGLSNQLTQKQSDLDNLVRALHDAQEHMKDLSNQVNHLTNAILEKDSQLTQKQSDLDNLVRALHDAQEHMKDLSNQVNHLTNAILEKDSQLTQKQSDLDNLANRLNQLSKEIQEQKQENARLLDKVATEERRNLEFNRQMDRQLEEKKGLLEEQSRLHEQINKLESMLFVKFYYFLRRLFKKALNTILKIIWVIPIVSILYLLFLAEGIAWYIYCFLFRPKPQKRPIPIIPGSDFKVSLVIPNRNGKHLLEKMLPSLFLIKDFSSGRHEVIIVDDKSNDGSISFIKKHYPAVRLLQQRYNKGFGKTCNNGIRAAKNEIIVLLNSDIIVDKNFLEPLVFHLKDPDVFAVGPKMFGWDYKTFTCGVYTGQFEQGYIRFVNEAEINKSEVVSNSSPTLSIIGAAMVFRRSDFLYLGEFDSLFRPYSWEDLDICYRAWKRGLKVIYEPASIVYHKGHASIGVFKRHGEIKNEIIFIWKNITNFKYVKEHFNFLYNKAPWPDINFLSGFTTAVLKIFGILLERFLERKESSMDDRRIFKMSLSNYFYFKKWANPSSHKKRHILIVSRFLPFPLNSGGRVRLYKTVETLSKGFDFSIMAFIDDNMEFAYIDELKKIFKEVYPITTHNIPIGEGRIFPKLFPRRYWHSYSKEMIQKLQQITSSGEIDAVQIESNELLYLRNFCSALPIIYTEHDLSILSLNNSYYKKASWFQQLLDWLKANIYHRLSLRWLDCIFMLSYKEQKLIKRLCNKSCIYMAPTGVDTKHFIFKPKSVVSEKLIFLGHYLHYPNEDAVLYFYHEILPLIREKKPNVEFWIVGSNPTEKIKALEIDAKISIFENVSDTFTFLTSADVFVNSVRLGGGIKSKLLEAMSVGLPIVSTRSGIDSFVQPEKIALIADSPEGFANAVSRLLDDKKIRAQLVDNARKLVEEKYDWEIIARNLARGYNSIFFDRAAHYQASTAQISFVVNPCDSEEGIENVIQAANNLFYEGCQLQYSQQRDYQPTELHVELTYKCNSSCVMCDIWDLHARQPREDVHEMKISDIKRIFSGSKITSNLKNIVLSGGEPFLANDFIEIFTFLKNLYPKSSIGILSNLYDTDRVMQSLKVINSPDVNLWIGTSLDGIEEVHDKVRGKKGCFFRLIDTVKQVRANFPSINTSASFTITPYNLHQMLDAYNLASSLGISFSAQFSVERTAQRGYFDWSEKDLNSIERQAKAILQKLIIPHGPGIILQQIKNRTVSGSLFSQIIYWANLVRYQREKKRIFNYCPAGKRFIMLSPNGALYFCPMLKSQEIGNVFREDIDAVWNSQHAQQLREKISKGRCNCWLNCIVYPLVAECIENIKRKTEYLSV